MLNFLSDFFSEVLLVRDPCFAPELVDMFRPDIVVSENAERYLPTIPRDTLSSPLFFRQCYRENYDPGKDILFSLTGMLSYSSYEHKYLEWLRLTDLWVYRDRAIDAHRQGLEMKAKELIRMAKELNPTGPHILKFYNQYLG